MYNMIIYTILLVVASFNQHVGRYSKSRHTRYANLFDNNNIILFVQVRFPGNPQERTATLQIFKYCGVSCM